MSAANADGELPAPGVGSRPLAAADDQRSPLRVLMLTWEYPPYMIGGLGKHVVGLSPALARLGVEIHVVVPRFNGGAPFEMVTNGVAVHRVALAAWQTGDVITDAHEANSRITARAETLVQEHGPFDLIHAHDWLMALSAFHFKHEYKWPLLATIHATERGRSGGQVHDPVSGAIDHFEWQLCYEAWRVIVTSRYMARQLQEFFQLPRGKIDIVPNGIDLSAYRSVDAGSLVHFRRRFARDGEAIVFFVGRLVHEKGVQTLVQAAPRVLSEFPNVRFVIAGRGPMHAQLQSLALQLGVAKHFNFVGFVSDEDRDRLYQVADVAVFPSLYEPFGIVALEAMAAGTPVVASDTGGLAEVVDARETGLVHGPGDPESLAEALRYILRYPDEAAVWARNAQRKVHTLFSWDNVARETLRVYERIVSERQLVDW